MVDVHTSLSLQPMGTEKTCQARQTVPLYRSGAGTTCFILLYCMVDYYSKASSTMMNLSSIVRTRKILSCHHMTRHPQVRLPRPPAHTLLVSAGRAHCSPTSQSCFL